MKIIDLLNKLANREKVPEHIKIDNCNWNFIESENTYYDDKNYGYLNWDYYVEKNKLNEEVEIIEEESKIPEKIGSINYSEDPVTLIIHHKVDEIIDYLKSKGE